MLSNDKWGQIFEAPRMVNPRSVDYMYIYQPDLFKDYLNFNISIFLQLNLQPVTWDGRVVPQNQIQNFHFYSVYSAAWWSQQYL